MHSFTLHSGVINSLFRERSLFRAGEGVDDIREWYGYLRSPGGGVMEYPHRKKEGSLEINEHFIHSKEYGFIVLIRTRKRLCHMVASLPDLRIT